MCYDVTYSGLGVVSKRCLQCVDKVHCDDGGGREQNERSNEGGSFLCFENEKKKTQAG